MSKIIDQINDLCELNVHNIHCVNEYDITPFAKLYLNCKYISSSSIHDGSGGLIITSISPETWFDKLLPYLIDSVKIVTDSRRFQLFSFQLFSFSNNDQIKVMAHECDIINFDSDEKIIDFLSTDRKEDLVIYYIAKYVNLSTLIPFWSVAYYLISNPKVIRDRKICSIIN